MSNATDLIVSLISKDAKRLLKLYFPNDDGPEAGLLVNHLLAEEAVSQDFTFTVTLASDDAHIELTDVQGKMVCVELLRDDGSHRYFNGHCFEFALQSVANGLAIYQMILKPWLALFSLRRDHFLFHNKNISDQTKEIFRDSGWSSHELRIVEPDPVRTFSCQHDETDYNYLHRRWEEMGWLYWYEHSMNGHKLILSDSSPLAEAIDGKPVIAWHHDGGSSKEDKIVRWSPLRKLVSGKVALANFDFKKPLPQRVADTSSHKQGDIHKVEVYQYEGLYGYKDGAHGEKIAQRRMEQIDGESLQFRAKGDCRHVQPGRWFELAQEFEAQLFDSGEKEFFILAARHVADNNYLNTQGSGASYDNSFTCLPRNLPWRPAPGSNSEAPRVTGVDTATVVGPKGEEIHTDQYGRIKIQFHWDREGKFDENSSAWVRVQTPWADSHFGMIALPRIGSEVVVQFLQGNPDRPLVTGQLYNQRHMPPWDLPANKTMSGILTRSCKGGTAANANALRFEDKKGAEQVWLQAERNMDTHVEQNDSQTVGNDRTIKVNGHHTETIVKNMTLAIDGFLSETIQKDMSTKVTDGKQDTTVKGDISVTSSAGAITLTSPKQITLVVGNSYIVIAPNNIVVHSPKIDLNPS